MKFSSVAYWCCGSVVSAVAVAFLSWTLERVFVFARESVRAANARNEEEEKGLCPCIFGCFNIVETTAAVTLGSIDFVWLGVLTTLIDYVWIAIVCHNNDDCDLRRQKYPKGPKTLMTVVFVSLFVGYALMFVTHFERLRMAFAGSNQQLPEWAPKVLYCVLFAEMIFYTIGTSLRYKQRIVSTLAFVSFALVYLGSVSALIGKFIVKTMSVANSTEQCDKQIIAIALRIGVSASVSLLCTTLTFVVMVSRINVCPHCLTWRFARVVVQLLDVCLNSFCLLCAFHRAEPYYMCVFGRVHEWWLSKLTSPKKPKTQTVVRKRPTECVVLVKGKSKTRLASATTSIT